MIDVTVQIVNYKTKEYLKPCIDSVRSSLSGSRLRFEILILENGSGDDLSDLKHTYDSGVVVFFESKTNLGFGGGHNVLAKHAHGKYLFVLNPDTEVVGPAIDAMNDFMESHPEAGICGPRVILPGRTFFFHKKMFWPRTFVWREFLAKYVGMEVFRDINALEQEVVAGSAMLVRKDAFDAAGGFDEKLFLYFEEWDLCKSVRKLGYKVFFVYSAVVKHFYGKSMMAKEEKGTHFRESMKYVYRKWYGEKAEEMIARDEPKLTGKFFKRYL